MRPTTHLTTPSEALRRVFLLPCNDASTRAYSTCPTLNRKPNLPQCLSLSHPLPLRPRHPRLASTNSEPDSYRPSFRSSGGNPNAPPQQAPVQHPRNERIFSPMIQLVRPQDSRLTEPLLLSDVLAMRRRDQNGQFTEFVQQVAAAGGEHRWPVCRMLNKKAVREAEEAKQAELKKKTRNGQAKRLEMSWTVTDNDLAHRMVRLKEFLEKGWKVEVLFGSQRKSGWMRRREVSAEEAEAVLEKIRKAAAEVERTWERKMQGQIGKVALLSFERRAKD